MKCIVMNFWPRCFPYDFAHFWEIRKNLKVSKESGNSNTSQRFVKREIHYKIFRLNRKSIENLLSISKISSLERISSLKKIFRASKRISVFENNLESRKILEFQMSFEKVTYLKSRKNLKTLCAVIFWTVYSVSFLRNLLNFENCQKIRIFSFDYFHKSQL